MTNILLVEDNLIARIDIASEISSAGYNVLEAGALTQALSIYENNPIQLIVTDGDYEDGTRGGIELIEKARADNPDLPIIVVTGKEQVMKDSLAKMGVRDIPVLSKPVDHAFLIKTIQAFMDPARGASVVPSSAAAAPEWR